MTRLVLLQYQPGREIHVLVGAATIESATGLTPEQVASLDEDDRDAIWEAMKS
jgi:hypothetical protein